MSESENTKRCFLGMPGYGSLTASAALGFFHASKGTVIVGGEPHKLVVDKAVNEGSLLAQNFNALWCMALNKCLAGQPVDYFAMLHSDVEPGEGWLDRMIDELEAKDLDVLSAVVPLKCPQGLTSTALDRRAGDSWRPLCRLTLKEIHDLPETFTEQDTGHPLLLNTGCWVCRFDPAWAELIHFEIKDRITFDPEKGKWICEVEPEDWNFSRQCDRLGLRLGATRKITLTHCGTAHYGSGAVWGDSVYDVEYVSESVLRLPKSENSMPLDIEGWLLPEEGEAIAELASGKRVLEIGSFCGLSTVCMARTAKHVTAVDYFDGRGTPRRRDTLPDFTANIERYGLADKVEHRHPDSPLPLVEYDFVFIDGAHDYDSVVSDIAKALNVLAPGGLIAFHDYRDQPGEHNHGWDPDVTQAVNELIAEGGELVSRHATVAVVKPPALIPLEV